MESGIEAETIAGRLKEPNIVRPSRRRKAEYVASGMRVRPNERAVLGAEDEDDVLGVLAVLGVDVGVGVGVGVDVGTGVGLGTGAVFCAEVLPWPNSWANLTSFQMPTEELTMNVVANVVMPAMAWSIFGYHLPRIVSVALAVAKVAV
jgi:hypothetical protein